MPNYKRDFRKEVSFLFDTHRAIFPEGK
jgi:hypothetical protein